MYHGRCLCRTHSSALSRNARKSLKLEGARGAAEDAAEIAPIVSHVSHGSRARKVHSWRALDIVLDIGGRGGGGGEAAHE
jgi:hypothetical protein